jgi:hypothetical protein
MTSESTRHNDLKESNLHQLHLNFSSGNFSTLNVIVILSELGFLKYGNGIFLDQVLFYCHVLVTVALCGELGVVFQKSVLCRRDCIFHVLPHTLGSIFTFNIITTVSVNPTSK